MNFVAAKAKIGGGGGFGVATYNAKILSSVASRDLPPLLCRVVFLGQPHFRPGADRHG